MKFFVGIGLLAVAVALHIVALAAGIYDAQIEQEVVWFDNVLHALVGIAFALIGLFMLDKMHKDASAVLQVVTALSFVLVMAVAWELLELVFYLYFKSHALGLKVYSPTLSEAIFDSASNLLGACAFLLWTLKSRFIVWGSLE